ncbi:type III restriction enzyme [Nakamurella sp. UYEF19]|uniref:DEAD/DEAH box helicase n=1 Tax=Nakamurella sp. UYEF19 TaxID=1756392 RepID=UPI003397F0ED
MTTLFQFQEEAAATVADRFLEYLEDPPQGGGTKKYPKFTPFFQALSALTGAGKTVVLAEAVSQVASTMAVRPIIIWLSVGKVVVRQAFANLSPGGKYHTLLDNTRVVTLADFTPSEALDATSALLCFATVGTFNRSEKENSTLSIFKSDVDQIGTSIWEELKVRVSSDGVRRPLFIVYDEGHRLTDPQTELLLELEPDAFLLASATMKLPSRLAREYEALGRAGWTDDRLVTRMSSKAVVESGLIKAAVDLAGYNTPMEETVSQLIEAWREATVEAAALPNPFQPKAMYVCNTNMTADDAYVADDPKQLFEQRQAPPILIWRYLVEQLGVDPATVAVYASLKVHAEYPLPDEFILYRGADKDYETFTEGNYKHIIFNLGLQEGWDDPEVYFAYIDKSMDSRIQIAQVIGRVLRQPNAMRYAGAHLNTAYFYVRVDRNEVFAEVADEVEKELGAASGGAIKITTTPPGKKKPIDFPVKVMMEVPYTGLNSVDAQKPIHKLTATFADYREPSVNTTGTGSRKVSRQVIGGDAVDGVWETFEQASKVSARWVLHREVQRRFREALDVVDLKDGKLNAQVGVNSPAFQQVRELAEKIVNVYIDEVRIKQRLSNPYVPKTDQARPDEVTTFINAIHSGYAGLNSLELPFARAVDQTGLTWCRNPSRVGYGLPLVAIGATSNFYPDFLIWTDTRVICVDTKGGHLVRETAGRKLLHIQPHPEAARRLDIQFVTDGFWDHDLVNQGPDGYTRWGLNDEGKLKAKHFDSLAELVEALTRD